VANPALAVDKNTFKAVPDTDIDQLRERMITDSISLQGKIGEIKEWTAQLKDLKAETDKQKYIDIMASFAARDQTTAGNKPTNEIFNDYMSALQTLKYFNERVDANIPLVDPANQPALKVKEAYIFEILESNDKNYYKLLQEYKEAVTQFNGINVPSIVTQDQIVLENPIDSGSMLQTDALMKESDVDMGTPKVTKSSGKVKHMKTGSRFLIDAGDDKKEDAI
jgi:hypothetical protein